MGRRVLACVLIGACFAPAIPATIRKLYAEARLAAHLLPLSDDDRRITVLGWPERAAAEIRRSTSPDEPVDLVMLEPGARDMVVFTGALIAPRPCRFFESHEAFARRDRAEFLRDALAANAPPGPVPPPARVVVFADSQRVWVETRP
jgi:hypothetical protein